MPSSSDSQRNLLCFSFYHTYVCSTGITDEVWEIISGLFIYYFIFFPWSLLPGVLTTHIWALVIIQLGVLPYLLGAEERNQDWAALWTVSQPFALLWDWRFSVPHQSCFLQLFCHFTNSPNLLHVRHVSLCPFFFSPSNASPLCLSHVLFLTGGWDE